MTRRISTAATLLLLLAAGQAGAVSGAGAICNIFDTSARSEAMGGAGVALVWGTHPDRWANPALLAYADGLRFSKYESRLAEGLASGIRLTNEEFTYGGDGWGVLLADGPADGLHLDMGTQTQVDDGGMAIGSFDSWMRTESWGFGVDFIRITNRIAGRELIPWSDKVSLSGGWVEKTFMDELAPDWVLQDATGGSARATSRDMGMLLKIVPLEMNDLADFGGIEAFGLRAGLAGGWSLLDDSDEFLRHVDAQQADPFPRRFVRGWSAHLALPLSEKTRQGFADGGIGLLTDMLDPLVSFTWTRQDVEEGVMWNPVAEEYEYRRDAAGAEENSKGWEFGFGNLFFVRRGHIDGWGDINDDTEGWGFNLPIGDWGGFRWEEATFPQATGLPKVEREVWTLWLGSSFTDLF